MAEHLLSDFKIDKHEPKNGILELVKIIKPHWNGKNVQMESLGGGYSNIMFKCYDPKYPDEMICVRIQDLIESLAGFNYSESEIESKVIQHLSMDGHFPKIHAIFNNGYCYKYVKGIPMINVKTGKGFINDKMLKSVAKELAYIHEVKVESVDYSKGKSLEMLNGLEWIEPLQFKQHLITTKETFLKELQVVKEFIRGLNIPLGLCHCDPHPGNFVWNDESDKITLVDWEDACIGYRHVDLAYFICAAHGNLMFAKENDMIFPEDFENKFLFFYYEEFCSNHKITFNDEDFQKFKELVHKCKLGPSLLFLSLSILMPDAVQEFSGDKTKYIENMLKIYQDLKEEILGTRKYSADL